MLLEHVNRYIFQHHHIINDKNKNIYIHIYAKNTQNEYMLACFPSCIATNIFAEKIDINLNCRTGD